MTTQKHTYSVGIVTRFKGGQEYEPDDEAVIFIDEDGATGDSPCEARVIGNEARAHAAHMARAANCHNDLVLAIADYLDAVDAHTSLAEERKRLPAIQERMKAALAKAGAQ